MQVEDSQLVSDRVPKKQLPIKPRALQKAELVEQDVQEAAAIADAASSVGVGEPESNKDAL
jgi:hypothetical protein